MESRKLITTISLVILLMFLKRSLKANYFIGIDCNGAGLINRKSYDHWFSVKAPIKLLPRLHDEGNHYISKNKKSVEEALGIINVKPISRFDWGDSAFWSVENLSYAKLEKLKKQLKLNHKIRFKIIEIDSNEKYDLKTLDTFFSNFSLSVDNKKLT